MKKKTAKLLILFSFVLGVVLLVELLLSRDGILGYRKLKLRLEKLSAEVADLRNKKRELEREVLRMSTDEGYLEEIARREYDFIRGDEIILKFVEIKKKKQR